MMKRRTFLHVLGTGIFAHALAAIAQPARNVPVIGVLATTSGSPSPQSSGTTRSLLKGLRELGYVDGENMVLEFRSAFGKPEGLPVLTSELVQLKPAVLYAIGPAAVQAAANATHEIPIVAFDLETDPVQSGLVRSLSRPGGNLTGLFLDLPALAGKWLELAKQVSPGPRRVGLLWDSTTGSSQLVAAQAAAQRLGIDLQVLEVRSAADLDAALSAAVSGGSGAIVTLSSPIVENDARQIAAFAIKKRLPAISMFRAFSDAGGLMSYGPNLVDFRLRAAGYVDKILKGTKPADLPIEQPTKFELIINLKTAKALGLTIPQSLLVRADEVIQ